VTLDENNEPVKTFFADRMDPALGKCIGFRRANGSFDPVDTFGFKDGVEDRHVLAIAIADQEARQLT
jgi:hypothetical protein